MKRWTITAQARWNLEPVEVQRCWTRRGTRRALCFWEAAFRLRLIANQERDEVIMLDALRNGSVIYRWRVST